MKISLCMIVKNEENNLPNCLESVKDLVDEINIVDTGSTDKTIEIAKKYTDRVFHFDWVDDFSAARTFSFQKATKEYAMWLDADDIIDGENKEAFKKFKAADKGKFDCYFMKYNLGWNKDGALSEYSYRERVVRRSSGFIWLGAVHEALSATSWEAKITTLDIAVTHTKEPGDLVHSLIRNSNILMKAINEGKATPMDYYYYGTHLSVLGLHERAIEPLKYFIEHNNQFDFTGVDAFIKLYTSYMTLGDRENAYLTLALNEEVNRDKAEYYCTFGNFMEAVLKDYGKAIEYYQKALKCEGKERGTHKCKKRNEDYYYYEPLYRLGQCFLKLKDYKNARDYFEKALKYRPNDDELAALTEKISKLVEIMP